MGIFVTFKVLLFSYYRTMWANWTMECMTKDSMNLLFASMNKQYISCIDIAMLLISCPKNVTFGSNYVTF